MADWEAIFASGRRWNRYPPEELVRFCADLPIGAAFDFGCGPGAGTSWFLAREGWKYYGWDISETARLRTGVRFINEKLICEFCASENMLDDSVDLFVDIQTLQHCGNPIAELAQAHRILKPGCRIFSMWVGEASSRGPYAEFGYTHYAKYAELRDMFAQFDPHIGRSTRSMDGTVVSLYVITGTKRGS